MGLKELLTSPLGYVPIPEHVDLYSYLQERMLRNGGTSAIINVNSGEEYTYDNLLKMTETIAKNLGYRGVGSGDTVVLYAGNCVEFALMVLASLRLAVKVAAVNHLATADELCSLVKLCDGNILFTTSEVFDKAVQGSKGTNIKDIICAGGDGRPGCVSFSSLLEDTPWLPSIPPARSLCRDPRKHVACILFSSGTTGLPKATAFSHFNLIAAIHIMAERTITNLDSHNLLFFPLSHVFGLTLLLINFGYGSCTLLMEQFDLAFYLKAIQKYKVKALQMVPPVAVSLAKDRLVEEYDLTCVERIYCGAAPLTAEIEKEFIDVENGNKLGPNGNGELWVRSSQNMMCYLGNQAATKNTITEDGWLKTGDIGHHDEHGYLYITDRLKELIKYKGYQVAPAELEGLILSHPAVSDCGVIGLPDAEAGELPHAWVVKKEGVKLTGQDIQDFVAGRAAPFKKLKGGVRFVDDIPRTASGKILRREMKQKSQKSKL